MAEHGIASNLLGDVATVDSRHDDIEKDDVRLEFSCQEPCFGAVVFLTDDVTVGPFQRKLEEPGKPRLVVYHENALFFIGRHGSRDCARSVSYTHLSLPTGGL